MIPPQKFSPVEKTYTVIRLWDNFDILYDEWLNSFTNWEEQRKIGGIIHFYIRFCMGWN